MKRVDDQQPVTPERDSIDEASDVQKAVFRWVHIANTEELVTFYQDTLVHIRSAAEECGYAIGVHGSMHRDLDLIAVPWTEAHASEDALARAIHRAACGLTRQTYQWERRPCGRRSTMFPVCWIDYEHVHDGTGHIDLSVMPGVVQSESAAIDTERMNWLERMVVEARVPMRWGSKQLFISTPVDVEGMEDDPSDIRAQIDYQRNGGKKP